MNAFEQLRNHQPLFAEARGDIAVSFEFFPPKTEKMAENSLGVDPDLGAASSPLRIGYLRCRRIDP